MMVPEMTRSVMDGRRGIDPEKLYITGSAFVFQTTQFVNTPNKYHNYYLLVRVGDYFGACCHAAGQADLKMAEEVSGMSVKRALGDGRLVVQIAALDAYFGNVRPHWKCCERRMTIPAGDAASRAEFRDRLIVQIASVKENEKVALIGVVNPLVKAIRDRGGICLPCDLQMKHTQWGDAVESDMEVVLEKADKVICTAMTLSNGTFDRIREVAVNRNLELIVYGQTGSAVVAQYVNDGVSALIAEPFPFSQFTAEESSLYIYQG